MGYPRPRGALAPPPSGARPAPSHARHVRSGPRPPSALSPPLSSRSPLGRFCASAAASVAAPAPSSASPPLPPPGASGGRLSGWPRASAVPSASRQLLPQKEARGPRSLSGPQFSPFFRRRGSWRNGRGRGTGRRGSNGRQTGGYPYLRMRGSAVAAALPHRPPPSAESHPRRAQGRCTSGCWGSWAVLCRWGISLRRPPFSSSEKR